LGKVKLAEILARAGLHLGATTVGRILKEPPALPPTEPQPSPSQAPKPQRIVTAKRPNHVWHVDLTVVPTPFGFWVAWLPFALPQCWPFAYYVAVALDHFSRRVMGVTAFMRQPTSRAMRGFLGRAMHTAGAKPKYLISDKGSQFWCPGFKDWCHRKGFRPRFGALGQHGSIAVIERFILTMKLLISLWPSVPLRRQAFLRELQLTIDWYNRFRPHMTLVGRTPHEVYHHRSPANRAPRFEPRPGWPRGSPCAKPQTLVKGQPGVRLEMQVAYHEGRKHLPLVTLHRAA